MKKVIIGVLIAALFIVGGAGAFLVMTSDANDINNATSSAANNKSGSNSSTSTVVVDACDVLTEKVVKEIIGQEVQKIATPASGIGTADNSVSNCNFITKMSEAVTSEEPKLSGASLLVYAAKTPAGAESNKLQFKEKPADVQPVEGIGDDAFYNPDFRQLHVLKGSNWYVVTSYKDSILNSSLESNKELAKKLKFE